ncbi:MAG: DUF5995 family protein [Saprospiraceae bacterium]
MPAINIDEVLERLDFIIESSQNDQDPHGAFAALYRRVTAAVKDGIAAGQFDDGPRMERLDVVFANRYLDAWEARKAGKPVTEAWASVFETAGQGRKLLLQHLLLGMNAHINLDLGIAAATVCPGAAITDLRADFNRINDLLVQMVDSVQDNLRSVSPLLGIVDWFGKDKDERFAGFGLKATRTLAWISATSLAMLESEAERNDKIDNLDQKVARIGRGIATPPGFFGWVIKVILFFENKDIGKQIGAVKSTMIAV